MLDEPKTPMNPAWVSVLRYSCDWAARSSNELSASDALTSRLWENANFVYSPTFLGYTRQQTDYGELFYLKAFMDQSALRGQCNDLSDFLCTLMTSLGVPAKSQRTYSLSQRYTGEGDEDGRGWQILTEFIDPAGDEVPASAKLFTYHQFVIIAGGVWEPSFGFGNSNPPNLALGWSRDTQYKDSLVNLFYHYEYSQLVEILGVNAPGNPWTPMPMAGFVPDVTANDLL